MNRKLNKPIKSYLGFLKTYFLRGFTFANGMEDEAPKQVPESEGPIND